MIKLTINIYLILLQLLYSIRKIMATNTQAQRRLDASRLESHLVSTSRPVPEPGSAELWAQNVATDHMVTCRWTVDGGWDAPKLKPFGDLTISPLASCLHYATQCFEGMKVYRGFDNRVRLFRPDRNAKRLVTSAKRVSLPEFDPEQLVELIKVLVRVDAKSKSYYILLRFEDSC
jgi:branched-chain amino acid aminotransferase